MAYDLGALVTRMVVEGRQDFERAIKSAGDDLRTAARGGDELSRSFEQAQVRNQSFATTLGQSRRELANIGDEGRVAMRTVVTGLAAAGIAAAGLIGLSVAKYAEYDAAISRATAVTSLYGDELAQVRDLTRELGAETVFTATEAAQGVTELGKAGVATADILGGALAGSLDLAAAGEIGVAQAAQIAATTLVQFRLQGSETVHVADLLAAAAGKAQGGVTEMAAALGQSGLVASQMGLSVEETTGTLAAFASAGLVGSDAGTSFRTMLLALATPTKAQTDLLKQYNIAAYDQQGNFVGTTALAGQLQAGLAGATQSQRDYALGVIFGSDAIRAANVLYNQGAAGIAQWVGAVDDAGYAARIAGINQDNLRGDLEKLGGAWDSLMIAFGEGADGPLRAVIQAADDLISGFANMPPEFQQVILLGTAVVAGIALIGGAALVAVPKIIEFRAALAIMRAELPLTSAAAGRFASFLAGPWGVAIAAAVLGVGLLSNYLDSLKASSDEVTNSLQTATTQAELFAVLGEGREVSFWRDVTADLANMNHMLTRVRIENDDVWQRFTTETHGFRDALKSAGSQLGALAGSDLPAAQRAFRLMIEGQELSTEQLATLIETMPEFRDALTEQATALGINVTTGDKLVDNLRLVELAQGDSAQATDDAARAYLAANDEAEGLRDTLTELIDLLDEQNKAGQDAVTSSIAYQDALRSLGAQVANVQAGVEGYGGGLDIATEAGSENTAMLVDLAQAAWDAASAQLAIDGNTGNFVTTLQGARQAIIDAGIAMGASAPQAEALADQILRIPSQTEVEIIAETTAAQAAISGFITSNTGKRIRVTVDAVGGTSYRIQGAPIGFQEYGSITTVRARAAGAIDVPSNAGAVAQIRQAGELTVWAEHASGGEAYIPFAPDRRQRSLEIWAEAGRRLGVTGMAGGGVVGGSGSLPGMGRGETHIHFHNPMTVDPVRSAREAADLLEADLHV